MMVAKQNPLIAGLSGLYGCIIYSSRREEKPNGTIDLVVAYETVAFGSSHEPCVSFVLFSGPETNLGP